MKGASRGVRGLSSAVGRLGAAFGIFGAGGIVAGAARAFAEQERSERKLESVLRATGNAAGFSADRLKQYAAQLQQTTNFGDELTISAQAVLATFRNVQGKVFKDATKLALDLSTVMGTDLQSSVVQIGKALNDPVVGLTALQRVGITFSTVQKQQIKDFVAQNQVMKAQQVILAELSAQFGGAAAAQKDTFAGRLQTIKNELGDILEKLGAIAAGPLLKAARAIHGSVEALQLLRGTTPQSIQEINEQTRRLTRGTASDIPTARTNLRNVQEQIGALAFLRATRSGPKFDPKQIRAATSLAKSRGLDPDKLVLTKDIDALLKDRRAARDALLSNIETLKRSTAKSAADTVISDVAKRVAAGVAKTAVAGVASFDAFSRREAGKAKARRGLGGLKAFGASLLAGGSQVAGALGRTTRDAKDAFLFDAEKAARRGQPGERTRLASAARFGSAAAVSAVNRQAFRGNKVLQNLFRKNNQLQEKQAKVLQNIDKNLALPPVAIV